MATGHWCSWQRAGDGEHLPTCSREQVELVSVTQVMEAWVLRLPE